MKKILGLAVLGSVVAGGGAILGFLRWVNQPLQAVYPPQISIPNKDLEKPTALYYGNSTTNRLFADKFNNPMLSNYSDFGVPLQLTENILNFGIADGGKVEKIRQLPANIYSPKEVVSETEESAGFRRVMEYAQKQKLSDRAMSEIMQYVAKQFLGTRYKANLLDRSNEEKLVVWLDKFDCVLFVETVLAIARGVAVQDYSYNTFLNHLRDQRYRDGELNGYCSRLHYFYDWIIDNQRRGTVQNISLELGGVTLNKNLNFMSRHRNSYPRMVSNDSNYQCIVEMETNLAEVTVNYIPKNRIRQVYSQLQPGDIVAVATSIPGLDVTHTGLVYRNPNGNIGFIHASPIGRVTIARDLQRYVRNVRNAIGIVVARPIAPRTFQRQS